jgi:PilZ domain
MCIMAGVELKLGEEIHIEFTLPYSGEPVRVSSVVRNRKGYRYGCEFTLDGEAERKDVARLRQVLQMFGEEKSS